MPLTEADLANLAVQRKVFDISGALTACDRQQAEHEKMHAVLRDVKDWLDMKPGMTLAAIETKVDEVLKVVEKD